MRDTHRDAGPGAPAPPVGPPSQGAALVRFLVVVAAVVAVTLVIGAVGALVFIAALFAMVMVHELGHFITAKWAGMKVTEFFFGFGPRLWSVRRGETEYGIKAIPAGGYVRIVGMHNLEQVDPADEPRTYRQQSYPRRLVVAVSGGATHFVMAFLLLFLVFFAFDFPRPSDPGAWEVRSVSSASEGPAREAGFRSGDRVVSIDGRREPSWDDLGKYIRAHPGDRVVFVVERDGRLAELTPVLGERTEDGERIGFLGVGPRFEPLGPVPAAGRAGGEVWRLTTASLKALGSLVWNAPDYVERVTEGPSSEPPRERAESAPDTDEGENRLLSPVGTVRLGSQALEAGLDTLLYLLALINVFVGMFNLLPLPPLDGGHVAIATYERLRSRRGRRYQVDIARVLPVTYAVLGLMFVLVTTALWLDIVDPLSDPFG
jgi:membrane-associated protease RseP (regulator of RpoE activity)